jgi:hypothetical protein
MRRVVPLCVCIAFLATAVDAQAAKTVESVIPTGGVAGGVAVNTSTGDLYVQISDAGRVERFAADGTPLGSFGSPGSADGQFAFSGAAQIAVDQTDGSVYVADPGNNRVQRFSAIGTFMSAIGSAGSGPGELSSPTGVAVDPANGDLLVGDTGNARVQRFSFAGAYESELGTDPGDGQLVSPTYLGVDSQSRVVVLDGGSARVLRFGSTGAFDSAIGADVIGLPFSLTVDPSNDHIFVAALETGFANHGTYEFDGAGAFVQVHGLGAAVLAGGLALGSGGDPIYGDEGFSEQRVLVLTDAGSPPPGVAIDDVTDIGIDHATFNGRVNPDGGLPTTWWFEYSTDGVTWNSTPGGQVDAGVIDVPVAETVAGLVPKTSYRVRLVASKSEFGGVTSTSDETTFATPAVAPTVRRLDAGNRTGTAAWLGASINPHNSSTTYFVEYGTTVAYGSRMPASTSVDAGSGSEFVTVQQLVTGLQPNTTYHFRVVAENEIGTTRGPDAVFSTPQEPPPAPPGRAYEQVSPLDKNGGDVDRDSISEQYGTSGAAPSGNAVAYASQSQFAGPASGAPLVQYRSVRSSEGWSTQGISPPIATDPQLPLNFPPVSYLSDDLSYAIFNTSFPLTPGAQSLLGGSWGLYRQDDRGATPSYELLSAPDAPLPVEDLGNPTAYKNRFSFAAATPDMGHVVFTSVDRQLAPDGVPPGSGAPGGLIFGVYEWVDGQVRFVSKLPSDEPSTAVAGARSTAGASQFPGDHLISDDGERIFFKADADQRLYVREGGAATELVSVPERAGADASTLGVATFQAAKADDGSLALFTADRYTEDATGTLNLFLWNANASAGHQLTNLSPGDPAGGGVLGVVGASDDLSRVYFVGTGKLTPDAPAGLNLYLWHAGEGLRLLATLSGADGSIWSIERMVGDARYRDTRTTSDGRHFLFASRARLTAADTAGHKAVYLYDADAEDLRCVSCGDAVVDADARLFLSDGSEANTTAPIRLPRNLSADGRRVFFETDESLVSGDTNGGTDVYQWQDGKLSLVSSGQGAEGAKFVDASADGSDVFFTTRERLVGNDVDDQKDIYDARVGGGFPAQQIPPPCVGDTCQGGFAAKPELESPSSSVAGGDPPLARRASFSIKRLAPGQRRRLARGGTAALVVRVNKAGRIAATGVTRLDGKRKTVLSIVKRARAAGPVKLPLRLTRTGRRALSVSGRLRISMRVRFAGVREPKQLELVLVRGSSRKKGR